MASSTRLTRARPKPTRPDKPITKALSEWDKVHTKPALDRLFEVMTADTLTADRGDGSGRIRPSSLEAPCPRQQLLSFHGYRSLQGDDRLMRSGTWAHYRWQLDMLSAGAVSDIEVVVEHTPWYLRGSLDGLAMDGTPVEVKQMGSRWYRIAVSAKRQRPHEWHLFQVHGYMKATGTRECSLIYENRETLDWHEFRIAFDPEVFHRLEEKMGFLVEHIDAGTMPKILPGCLSGEGTLFAKCGWRDACFMVGDRE